MDEDRIGRRQFVTAAVMGAALSACTTTSDVPPPPLLGVDTATRLEAWKRDELAAGQVRRNFEESAAEQNRLIEHIAGGLAKVGVDLQPFVAVLHRADAAAEREEAEWLAKHRAGGQK